VGHKAKVSLYRLFNVAGKHRYVPIVRKGRSCGAKIETTGTPGSYYLRYPRNGRRTFESVGDDLQVALQEQKVRQASLNAPTPVAITSQRKTLREDVPAFLTNRPELRYILGVFGDWCRWVKDQASFERNDFQAFATHLTKLPPC